MDTGKPVFAQIMDFLPTYAFHQCVGRYHGHYKMKSFSCWDQFLCMAFAQLTYRESLRDIETCLRSAQRKLYHMGIRGKCLNTLSRKSVRDWRIYADFAQVLIGRARRLYVNDSFGVELDQTAYALDSTTIDLCLSLFPWAKFRKHKGAVKLHTLLDLREAFLPCHHYYGKIHDVTILDQLIFEPGAFYIVDRGYLDFARLYVIHQSSAFFVTRTKSNFSFKRLYSRPIDKSTDVQCDQIIILEGFYARKDYPEKLRRIRYFDTTQSKHLVFLTNNFTLPALTIAQLYQCRWKIELFFKWIKHLQSKLSWHQRQCGQDQIWIAITVYVLMAIVKKQLKLDQSLYTILQILSIPLFEKHRF
jgi:hypothetical protein